jgi:hypothetical protein
VRIRTRFGLLMIAAAVVASCADVVPSQSADRTNVSQAPTTEAPPSTAAPTAPSSTPPTPTPAASEAGVPPYRIVFGDEPVIQERGTILFGSSPGPIAEARLEPFLTWPDGGLTIDAPVAFGAFWGEPVEASEVRITLYRVAGGTLRLVWSDTKSVPPESTGYFDALVPFEAPGTYRLEVTRGPFLLAWGLAHMGPRCKSDCSGG